MKCPNCHVQVIDQGGDRMVCTEAGCGFTIEKKTIVAMTAGDRAAMVIAQKVVSGAKW